MRVPEKEVWLKSSIKHQSDRVRTQLEKLITFFVIEQHGSTWAPNAFYREATVGTLYIRATVGRARAW